MAVLYVSDFSGLLPDLLSWLGWDVASEFHLWRRVSGSSDGG